ncbi:citrate lyase beta like protein [Histomonas meleagridis]|uniref:citrate lyase beta like protein n=1 Tax=Histomonas meleagridis TaxID=135588 RepID=UPI00355955FB|nr:citrate lyase beta like protein [Histomonas meleagridis]KAH0806980.1 citrate lyase beta like protein [Histomonas meleagridis]
MLRPRRQVLYAPSSEVKKLEKASKLSNLDTVVFDLEDGVSTTKKEIARKNLVDYLNSKPKIIPELAIRTNNFNSYDGMKDLNKVFLDPATSKRVQVLIMPKVEDVKEVHFVERWLHFNSLDHIKILAMIETPRGLSRVNEICAASKKLDGIIFGSEDYRSAAGISHQAGDTGILYARSAIVTAAKAYGLQAIDMTSLDFKHPENVTKDAIESRRLGFTGKQVIHPMQIECVNKAFTPSQKEMDASFKMVTGFVKNYIVDGKGVIGENGIMIELPHITDALKTLILGGKTAEEIQAEIDLITKL